MGTPTRVDLENILQAGIRAAVRPDLAIF